MKYYNKNDGIKKIVNTIAIIIQNISPKLSALFVKLSVYFVVVLVVFQQSINSLNFSSESH
jgi:hypothetical protein